jgi:hypothetical protein
MQLVVERSTEESIRKGGFLGTGKEKIHRTFILTLKLEGVTERQKEILELYTYITQSGRRERLINNPISVMDEGLYDFLFKKDLLIGPRHVTVPELIRGVTWKCSTLIDGFAEIPDKVVHKMAGYILSNIAIGDLWSEAGREVIEIAPPREEQ